MSNICVYIQYICICVILPVQFQIDTKLEIMLSIYFSLTKSDVGSLKKPIKYFLIFQ